MGELFATFGIDVRLLVIQAVNFGLTLLVLWYFLFRPLTRVIDERQKKVAKGVRDAEEAAHAKARVEGERAGIITNAQKEAEAVVSRAVDQGKQERSEIVKAAQERAENTLRDVEAQSVELRRRALAESEKEIARTAILAAETLIRQKSA
ncbi:MAG: ATP synthase F0 subunit B [Patescibacteria group bacterium]